MTKSERFTVVGLGEILWDLLPAGKQVGGAPANFAYHAHVLGADACLVSRVGSDAFGSEIRSKCGSLALDCRCLQADKRHPTGTVDVAVDAQGNPQYIIHENVAWDFITAGPDVLELAARTDAVCFGSLCQRSPVSRNAIQSFLKATRPECLRVFDVNFRQSYYNLDTIEESLKVATVLKLNDQELPVLAKLLSITGSGATAVSKLLDRYSLQMVALTRGQEGSALHMHDCISSHAGCQVNVADTVGASDAFTAALVMGMLRSFDLDKINDYANRLGSYICTRPEATPEVPSSVLAPLFEE